MHPLLPLLLSGSGKRLSFDRVGEVDNLGQESWTGLDAGPPPDDLVGGFIVLAGKG
jgi:hypothetical protein